MPALIPITRQAPPLVQRPVTPYSIVTNVGGGVRVLARTDPVLRYLAMRQDEREYRLMIETEPAIGNAIGSVNATLHGFGAKIKPPRARRMGERAKKIQELVQAAIRRIDKFQVVTELLANHYYCGWLPMQKLWDTQAFMVGGRWRWGIIRILEQPQEHFAFTPDNNLVYLRQGVATDPGPPIVFDDPAERAGWLVASAGSTSSPYGHALLRGQYLTWKVKQSFFEWFSRGMRNATEGILKVIDEAPAPQLASGEIDAGEGAQALTQLAAEAKQALRYLQESGILIGRGGINFDLLTNITFSDGWKAGLDYLDMRMQVAIEGQQMSEVVRQGSGSRATTDNLSQVKLLYAQRLARLEEPIINEQIIAPIVVMNEPSVDPDDIPVYTYRVHDRVDPDKVDRFIAHGGELDAEEVADEWNLPIASPDSPDRPVLRRQAAPAVPRPGEDGSEGDDGEGDDDPRGGRPIRDEDDDADEAAKPRRGR